MLNIGAKQTPPNVDRLPFIPMLQENNVRQGFFEYSDFLALRGALPDYLQGFVTFAYRTGWRVSEIAGLTWAQVDLDNKIVRLEIGSTKNKEGRTVFLDDELAPVFQGQWDARKQAKKLIRYVFPNCDGDGAITDIRKAWNKACRSAGLGYGFGVSKAYVKNGGESCRQAPYFTISAGPR